MYYRNNPFPPSLPPLLLVPEENVATVQHDATVSDDQTVLLNGDTESYTGDHGYAIHTITRNGPPKGIVVTLNQPYIINCIKMLLWDRDNRSYSYYIEVREYTNNILIVY